MSEANRLATRAVLDDARYCPPYALFQFGHEIRVARLHFFYSLLRRAGLDVEEKVRADGAFEFDQIIHRLERRLGRQADPAQRPLYTDDEAIADVLCRDAAGGTTTLEDVARSYIYPMPYVEQVLWPKIVAAREACDRDRMANRQPCAVGARGKS